VIDPYSKSNSTRKTFPTHDPRQGMTSILKGIIDCFPQSMRHDPANWLSGDTKIRELSRDFLVAIEWQFLQHFHDSGSTQYIPHSYHDFVIA